MDKRSASTKFKFITVDALRLSTLPTQTQPNVGATPSRELTALSIATRRRSYGVGKQRGFTLLEMLLVIFLMALVASTGLMLTEGVEDQSKYDETKRRMELIRKAIIGDPTRTVNGAPEISGFVADMGRLPECLRELLEAVDCGNPGTALPVWNQDPNSGIGAGWRGPYLSVMSDHDSVKRFRDGYGNEDIDEDGAGIADDNDDVQNFGWIWQLYKADRITPTADPAEAVLIRIKSKGFDGLGGSADDYPDSPIDDVEPLVDKFDYEVNFQNWNTIIVRFQNNSASGVPVSISANALRLALSFSDDSQPDAVNELDSATFPSTAISVPSSSVVGSVNVTNATSLTVPTGTTLSGTTLTFNTAGDLTFTAGITVPVIAGNTANVPTGSTLAGTTLTIGSNGAITFPAGSVISVTTNFPGLPNIMGNYSLMVVCNDPANPNAVDGKRFDGDCDLYGDDATPLMYVPSNQPYLFSALPRSNPVAPPSPLLWTIE
ncbi:MAG: hypothetical protein CTY19_07365 [Methylomonas sp.]|nr:MAG: hypothetical protein CTY19_07365 [Methylomonas sp.]